MTHRLQVATTTLLLLGWFGLGGCAGRVDPPAAPAQRLLAIGNAYVNATNRLGRPPKRFQDIQPDLPPNATEDYLRSPGDGERFVILWGVDFNQLLPRRDDPFTVCAYEQKGVGGRRYVLRFPRSVAVMADDELRNAVFPRGHKPPP